MHRKRRHPKIEQFSFGSDRLMSNMNGEMRCVSRPHQMKSEKNGDVKKALSIS
jgi:hypothetical protein